MQIENDVKLDFKDVLIRPKRSTLRSRNEVNLSRTFKFKWSKQEWSGIPIIAANMDTVGTFEMYSALAEFDMATCIHKFYSESDWVDFSEEQDESNGDLLAYSIGVNDDEFSKFIDIFYGAQREVPFGMSLLCVDVANGYGEYLVEFVKKIRKELHNQTIIAGNVVTREMTEELILAGADIVKVGIGSGSACTTRIQTGVGYPQLSAIIECADAAHGLGAQIISDGGCVVPGDIAKAFGAGADFVMLGGMLAGHDESGGKLITEEVFTNKVVYRLKVQPVTFVTTSSDTVPSRVIEKKQYKEFYGMSSDTAMEKHYGGMAEYRSSEGRTIRVPYKGPVSDTILSILGGLRSACTYVGASELKHLSKCTTFIKVSQQVNNPYGGT